MSIADIRALPFGDAFEAHVVLDALEAEERRQRRDLEASRGR